MKNIAQDEINSPFLYESKTLQIASFQKLFEFVENDILCDLEIRAGSKVIPLFPVYKILFKYNLFSLSNVTAWFWPQ